jgi:hypothetical protein
MSIEIHINQTDDPQFIDLVIHVLVQLIHQKSPEKLFVIKIDNWFDHKWLNFSGIGRVGFFWGANAPDTALAEFSQDKITFPPFNPNRVIGEWYFQRDASGEYQASLQTPLVHQRTPVPSAGNLHKRVTDFAEQAIFMWLSSNTRTNSRGSIMVYEVACGKVRSWYASLRRNGGWKILQTKGIAQEQVKVLIHQSVI